MITLTMLLTKDRHKIAKQAKQAMGQERGIMVLRMDGELYLGPPGVYDPSISPQFFWAGRHLSQNAIAAAVKVFIGSVAKAPYRR